MKKAVITILIICAIGSVSFLGYKSKNKEVSSNTTVEEKKYTPVEIEKATKNNLNISTSVNGNIVADKEVQVIPKVLGKVNSINLKIGDAVNEGEVLFTLDTTDIQNKVNQAKIALESASFAIKQSKSSYEMAKANYNSNYEKFENAKINLERNKALYEQGIISKSQFEQAQLAASDKNLEVLKAQLKQAETSSKQAEIGYNQSKLSYDQSLQSLNDCTVKSPISGVITSINIEKGEMVSNMQPALVVVNLDKIYVNVSVTENLINKIKLGNEVKISIPSASKKDFIGQVHTISTITDLKTNLYSVSVEIKNSNNEIKPGMFASVKFITDSRKNVIAIKNQAVLSKSGKNIVYIENNGKSLAKEIELGLDSGEYVEVTKGLKEGDNVIIKGQKYVENNSEVKVVKGGKQ